MKTVHFVIFCFYLLIFADSEAQLTANAEKLINDGIVLHDQGKFSEAIAKYDHALELDKDNIVALAEKAYSLNSSGRFEECVNVCQYAIKTHPGESGLRMVYVTCGNAYDELKKIEESIRIYDAGLRTFPDFYLLHFNKGITLSGAGNTVEALRSFEQAIVIKPEHPGSHNAIGRMQFRTQNRVPAIMALTRFLVLESNTTRAQENLDALRELLEANVVANRKGGITISINSDAIANENNDSLQNNFATTDMILTLSSALDSEKKFKKQSEVEKFIRKMESVCGSLQELSEKGTGFYWAYYAPYFIGLHENNLLESFAYISYVPSGEAYVKKWVDAHPKEIENFFNWSNSFKWNAKAIER